MSSTRKFFYALTITFAIFFGLVYAIVTIFPVMSCLFVMLKAVCTGENQFLVAGVIFLISFLLTLIASPFIRYFIRPKDPEEKVLDQ